jgi:hypothetical protein
MRFILSSAIMIVGFMLGSSMITGCNEGRTSNGSDPADYQPRQVAVNASVVEVVVDAPIPGRDTETETVVSLQNGIDPDAQQQLDTLIAAKMQMDRRQ